MKIAYLLGSLNRGGAETLLLDIFKNASKTDFELMGIHRKDGALKEDFYATEQRFVHLSPKFPFDIFYFFKLRRLLKKENIQIVHAQQCLDALYAKIAVLGTKIKVVQTYHGFEKDSFLVRFIIKRTDENFFVSDYQREFYTKKYHLKPEKQATVYNGISFKKFFANDEKPNLPQKNENGLKLAMVGNFVRGREQNSVCKFLKLLYDKGVAFDFYFVGRKCQSEPYLYDSCVQYCNANGLQDCVHFLGSRNDVPAILKNIDAFVYSTDHDTFGIAVIEAIAVGIPVFVNDWEVMTEITNQGEWATLYKTKNEQDLLAKFMLFLQNRNDYAENAKKSAVAVRKKFSIENHIQNLEVQYKLLIFNSRQNA